MLDDGPGRGRRAGNLRFGEIDAGKSAEMEM